MAETYEQYYRRMSGLPDQSHILTQEQWDGQTRPKTQHEPEPEAEIAPKQYSSAEQTHMAVMAAEALVSDRLRANPPIDAWPKIGLTAEENARRVRESNEDKMRALQAQEEEDKRDSEERQRLLEKDIADSEHAREMAAKLREADLISDKARKAQLV